MHRLPLLVALLAVAPSPSCESHAREASPATASPAEERAQLEQEIAERRTKIRAELTSLGSEHPWAGEYYVGDGLGVNISMWIAPEAGCVVTWHGCLGLYGANWGKVKQAGDKLQIQFERPNEVGQFGNFYDQYTIAEDGESHTLVPPEHPDLFTLVR